MNNYLIYFSIYYILIIYYYHIRMFDLNINHYNNDELLGLLSIKKDSKYDIIEINSKYQILSEKIQKSNKTKEEKDNTNVFLEQVKNKLILNLSKSSNTEIINTLTANVNQTTSQVNPLQMASSSKSKNLFVQKLITIDTRFRPDYSSSIGTNFVYTTPQPIKNITKMDLVSVEIPQVYCIMSEYYRNSSFMIKIDNTEYMIDLPDIYLFDNSFTDYSNYMKLINLCNLYFKKHKNENIRRCSFLLEQFDNNVTIIKHVIFMFNKVGLTEDQLPKLIELNFEKTNHSAHGKRDLRSKLGWMLGFRTSKIVLKPISEMTHILERDLTLNEIELENYLLIRGDVPIQLHSAKYIYLVVDDFNSNKVDNFVIDDITLKGCDANVTLGGNVLAKILFDSGSQFFTVDRLVTIQRQYTGPVDISKLKISLIDEFGRILDLNKIDWSFSIQLST